MGTIVNFPSGKKIETNIITAYKVDNGMDVLVTETENIDNGNKVVGVSYKPANEERFTKIVDMEDWKKVKGILVDDIHDRKDNFVYQAVAKEINATEEFVRDLALRDENFKKLVENYAAYLKSLEPKEEKVADIVPFPTGEAEPAVKEENQPEIPAVSIAPELTAEAPAMEPTSIIESVVPEVPQMNSEDANNIMEFPSVANTIVEEQPQEIIVDTPVINEAPIVDNTNIVNFPSMDAQTKVEETPKEEGKSVVEDSYLNTANEIIAQMRELTNKYLQTMEEMAAKMHGNFKESQEYRKLSMQTYDNAQQILASRNQNVEETNSLTRAA